MSACTAIARASALAALASVIAVVSGCGGPGTSGGGGLATSGLRWTDQTPSWSPNGREIVFASNRAAPDIAIDQLYLMPPDGKHVTSLTYDNVDARDPSFSPDGSRIVYAANVLDAGGSYTGHTEIRVMHTDGSRNTLLASAGATYRDDGSEIGPPAWSPDGRLIAFYGEALGSAGLYVVALDGSGLRRVATGYTFAWAPHGERIAFEADDEQIHTLQIASGKKTRLTHNHPRVSDNVLASGAFSIKAIAWSPNGSQLAYVQGQLFNNNTFNGGNSWTLDDTHAFVVAASGGTVHQVGSPKQRGQDSDAAWLPGPTNRLVLSSENGFFLITAAGSQRPLTTDGCCADPSPQHHKLLLVGYGNDSSGSSGPRTSAIFLADADGRSIRQLTQTSG